MTPWSKDLLKEWDQLSADVFAAFVAYTDHEIGRVIQAIEDLGKLDNTLIVYINGKLDKSPFINRPKLSANDIKKLEVSHTQ